VPSICFYFQVHQPLRVKKFRVFDIGNDANYFNDNSENKLNNKKIMEKVANKCYLPTNKLLLHLLETHPEFKISFSLSGIFLEQIENDFPEVLKSFQSLVKTGRAEILSETYYHSLSFIYSKNEFHHQIKMHKDKVKELFNYTPTVFRNTELIFNNEVAREVENLGYKGILAEGADHVLGWRSPNFLYQPVSTKNIKVLLKNYRLSDDIAFRFSNHDWQEHPLSSEKFSQWVTDHNGSGDVINLFMDYETFGEHQWEDSGIFEFLRHLPGQVLKHPDNNFITPSEAIEKFPAISEIDFPHYVSWADSERDLSAWLSNSLQHDAINTVYGLEEKVKTTDNQELITAWRRLQTSDHFYYMCTKYFSDGDVHKYFNPYDTPFDAFINYMNALNDLSLRVNELLGETENKKNSCTPKIINQNHIIKLNNRRDFVVDLKESYD